MWELTGLILNIDVYVSDFLIELYSCDKRDIYILFQEYTLSDQAFSHSFCITIIGQTKDTKVNIYIWLLTKLDNNTILNSLIIKC